MTDASTPDAPAVRSPLDRALDGLASLCMALAGAALVVLIAIFGWLVWGRYVMNDTPTWVEQVSLLLVVWITCLGAGVGVRRDTHLAVEFIREALPARPRRMARALADLTVMAFGLVMVWQGWALAAANLDRMIPMLGAPEAWRIAPLVVCGALMTLFAGVRIALAFRAPAEED
jgi:TRAP-type C4-dicarboxylate transport system permease small subunit